MQYYPLRHLPGASHYHLAHGILIIMKRQTGRAGFTIVELLIVIVIIGILAAITIAVFNGVQRRAIEASLRADLDAATKKIMLYHVENTTYPSAINCVSPATTEVCVQPSGSNSFIYSANNTASPPWYTLTATNKDLAYQATQSSSPTPLVGPVTNGLVARLDAADKSSYPGSGTTWTDLSGSGRNATLTGVGYSASDGGGALAFDGTTSTARIASGSAQSIFMFVYIDSSKVASRYLLDTRTGNASGYIYNNGVGNWTNFSVDTQPVAAAWSSLPMNRWAGFYTSTASPYTSTVNLMSRYSNTEQLPGRLGVVLVYNRALTQAEITQNFNAYSTRYGLANR